MNYRHAYHAGNFADVVKHAALALLIGRLTAKPAGFCIVDTHAGIGRYDLSGIEAGKTGEYQDGIGRLLASGPLPAPLEPYVAAIRAVNPGWPGLRHYPGSPRIARQLLRPVDQLALVELHPEDVETLRREFAHDRQTGIHCEDAYVALKALLPPKERRGLVLIDPPFEVTDEFRRIARGLGQALRRWPTGIYAIWYPIKTMDPVNRFLDEAAGFGKPLLTAEFLRFPADRDDRLNGCGIAVINPPWQFDAALRDLLAVLADRLGAAGGVSVRWLRKEE